MPKSPSNQGEYFHLGAYLLSRYAFVMTHVAVAYFVLFLTNDPLEFGFVTTIDAKVVLPEGQCEEFNQAAFVNNFLWFFVGWWGSHSLLARKHVKVALGLWATPWDRPVFAFIASNMWLFTIHTWQPISNCSKFNVLSLSALAAAVSITLLSAAFFYILSLLYTLPAHVFGTSSHKYAPGTYAHSDIIVDYPYGLSRHPAAAGFSWVYALLLAGFFAGYTTVNTVTLSSFWLLFILVGTLVFEEGGISGEGGEFPKQYLEYRQKTGFLVPTLYSIKRTLGLKVEPYSWEKPKDQ